VGQGRAFSIVGIGASAGGLEAFTGFLKALPTDTGMAFVLVQHLDPEHESALTEILARATSLRVREIEHGQKVEPNNVYVIPRATNLSIERGVLKIAKRAKKGLHRPIDAFFESLAADQGDLAIGVVLSGTATDGTLGLEAIKAEGGITFAQDASAKYDSMPRSAIAAGVVDMVLEPAEIAKELSLIARHPYHRGAPEDRVIEDEKSRAEATAHEHDQTALPSGGGPQGGQSPLPAQDERARTDDTYDSAYKKIMSLLRNHSGVDFSLYKSSTIRRRIARRLVLTKRDTPAEYAEFLRGNSSELDSLYSDVLISVTSFFRNSEAFEALQEDVFPNLLERPEDTPLRCWILGCSTGQEAYSIAMVFVECAEKHRSDRQLQIFATDLNESLLEKARQGLYSKTLAEDISPARLRRFFVEEKGGYRVIKPLRDMVVFARQNLISDPPFSRMDLISCRNLLIYFEPSLQKKAIPTFHYALRPGGYLLLGASESVGGFTDLFEAVDRKQKIFRKKAGQTPAMNLTSGEKPAQGLSGTGTGFSRMNVPVPHRDELSVEREADRITINQFAPPAVVVNAELQILQFRGSTSQFLEPPVGKASFNVLKMAREGLMMPLRAMIEQAKKEGKPARRENIRIKRNGGSVLIRLEVIPLKTSEDTGFLIFFDDAEGANNRPSKPISTQERKLSKEEERSRVEELETEIEDSRAYFQGIQEQNEAANEELQAANEEVQSANEELQSVNEELETSKEELESANEELITVNDEMANRNHELTMLNNDLINFHNAVRVAMFNVDQDGTIRLFSDEAARQFDLLAADVGRRIGQIRHSLNLIRESGEAIPFDFEQAASEAVKSSKEAEYTVRDGTGRWGLMRVRPYVSDDKVTGAVMTLLDVDTLMRSEQAAAQLAAIVTSSTDAIIGMDRDGVITSWNDAALRLYGYRADEAIGKPVTMLLPEDHADEEHVILDRIRNGEVVDLYETVRKRKDGTLLNVSLAVSPVKDSDGRIIGAAKIARDITESKTAQLALRQSEERYRDLFNSMDEGYCIIEMIFDDRRHPVDYRFVEVNPAFERQAGIRNVVGKRMLEFVPMIEDHWLQNYGNVALTGEPVRFANEFKELGRWFEVFAFRVGDPEETRVAVLFNDITERRRSELENLQKQKLESMGVLAGGVAHDFNNLLTGVLGAGSLISDMPGLPEEARPLADGIVTACLRAADLTRQILAYAGKGRFVIEPVDLSAQVAEVVRLVAASVPKTVRFDLDLQQGLPLVSADRGQLQQVVMNLVINAAESSADGNDHTVSVMTRSMKMTARQAEDERNVVKAPAGEYVALVVKDRGGGMDEATLSQIFDPFFTTKESGRGLGLSAVLGIVRGHRGCLRIESSPRKGSTFTVLFPVGGASPSTASRKLPIAEAKGAQSASKDTILIVDDAPMIRQVVAAALEVTGLNILTAADGLEGVEEFQRSADRIAVVLLDFMMPLMDGQDALKKIRAIRPDVRVVAMSGYTERDAIKHFGNDAQVGFLQKPFTTPELLEALGLAKGHRKQ
jgi:two-component system CheB/CheR fusion protein